MKVFCPEHKKGFFTPRQNPIKCENKGHILGELDFTGETKAAVELQWQYCCNCEHFCPIDFAQNSLERCPVCTRQSSILYLCDRCLAISFESATPVNAKNFTLTSEGTPQPSCPGCLHAAPADVREHTCEVLGASFITALNSCPVCRERLDLAPTFPASVAHYLRRTKTANKANVTFDYETELFVPVEDGEFVLISNDKEGTSPIVLPRSGRFATRRDFYDFYQDYYHCTKPDAGEINIIQPASVMATAAGWKLQASGILEVLEAHAEKKAPTVPTRPQVETPPRVAPGVASAAIGEAPPVTTLFQRLCDQVEKSSAASGEGPAVTTCTHCGTLVEMRYAFCWKCANPMKPTNEPSVTRAEAPTRSAENITKDNEPTLEHDLRSATPPIFSWAVPKEPEPPTPRNRAMPKLIAIVVIGLMVGSVGLFVLTRSASRAASVTAAQSANPGVPSIPTQAPGPEVKGGVPTETVPQQTSAARPEDEELKKLSEKRITIRASDRSAILQAFAKAEEQYPNDYRFPYERAKLNVRNQPARSNAEAFDALTLAAVKAINSGKAHEMLGRLQEDKDADLHKLSHGHHEWVQLLQALKSKDTKRLSAKQQL